MRILQVYMGPYVADKGGGVSVYVRNISERLAKRHDVTVFATNPGSLPRFEVVNGVKVERFRRIAPGGAYFFSLDMLLRLRKAEFDVVHGHCYQAFPVHFSTLARKKRFIVSTHLGGLGVSQFRGFIIKMFKPFGERTLKFADKIIVSSNYEKDYFLKHFDISKDKVLVIPCGVDLRDFEGLKKSESDVKHILFVGRLHWYKGVHYLIEALPKLKSDIVLEIVGTGPAKQSLIEKARKLKVHSRVRFYENIPRKELVQKYINADVFVLPSQYESYAIVVAEALAAGVPCIVSRNSALVEWIDNETCFGLSYPIKVNELVDRINYVLGSNINKDVTSKKWIGIKILDWDDIVKRLEALYI